MSDDIQGRLRDARNAGIAGWLCILIIVGAVVASKCAGPPGTPVPSPTPTVEVTR